MARGYVFFTFVTLKQHYFKEGDKASLCLSGHNPLDAAAVSVFACQDFKCVGQHDSALLLLACAPARSTSTAPSPPHPLPAGSWERHCPVAGISHHPSLGKEQRQIPYFQSAVFKRCHSSVQRSRLTLNSLTAPLSVFLLNK